MCGDMRRRELLYFIICFLDIEEEALEFNEIDFKYILRWYKSLGYW